MGGKINKRSNVLNKVNSGSESIAITECRKLLRLGSIPRGNLQYFSANNEQLDCEEIVEE